MRMIRSAALAALAVAAPLMAQQPTYTPRDSAARAAAVRDTLAMRRTLDSLRGTHDSLLGVVKRDTVLHPSLNEPLGLDAEVRAGLYELLGDQVVPALARLQRVATAPVALSGPAGDRALRGRQDLLFLLAQAQYRFGMDSAFRRTAETVLASSPSPRYSSLLGTQLVMAAYRSGDYVRAVQLARQNGDAGTRTLTSLVGGLAAYQIGDLAAARTSFASAQQSGAGNPALGQYARYMDILTGLRADTSAAASALQALEALASSSSGELADQVRSTAAQLAYERGAYDQAARFADGVGENSGYGAASLLIKGWSQYKGGKLEDASRTFATFADRYPQLPERDESRLMAAQALLQLGRTEDAGRVFHAVADTANGEARMLEARAQQAMGDAARALVQARAAGLLFLNDPTLGKTISLADGAGADRQTLVAAVSDGPAPAGEAIPVGADLVTLGEVQQRLARVDSLAPSVPRRVFFTPTATGGQAAYGARAQALFAADLSVATARYSLEQQLAAYRARIALLEALRTNLGTDAQTLASIATQLQSTQARLAALLAQLDAAAVRMRAMLVQQAEYTRQAADENSRMVDSLQRTFGAAADSNLAIERQTIDYYRQVAALVSSRIDTALRHHPVLALRDSVRARGERVRALLGETQTAMATARQLVDQELTRLRGSEPTDVQRSRSALASAEGARTTAESGLMAAVDAELRARAGEMLAELRRDTEAAEFGTASASFFQAIDQTKTGTAGATGTSGAAAEGAAPAGRGALVSARTPSPKK